MIFPFEGKDFLIQDFETKSEADITEVGTDNYVRHPTTQPLMLSYVRNKAAEIELWEPDIQQIPTSLLQQMVNPNVIKVAFNVPFERGIWEHCLKVKTPIEQWFDVKTLARYHSIPGSLKEVCIRYGFPPEIQKMSDEGEKYIQMFSIPARIGGGMTLWGIEPTFYNSRENKPEEWKEFIRYCKQDTVVERYILYHGMKLFVPEPEIKMWYLDQKINSRGLPVNVQFVKNALEMAKKSIAELETILTNLTGLVNPNSDQKMLEWMTKQGYPFTSLNKDVVKVALKTPGNMTPLAQEVLLIRKEYKRSSYTKLETLLNRVNENGRILDCFSFMGGARTGRWAGQDMQFQNLARPDKKVEDNFKRAMELIETNNFTVARDEFGVDIEWCGQKKRIPSVLGMVISCIRSIFQAKANHILIVCDLSAIENRVLGWLAGCQAILDVFKNNLDAYKAFATMMYMIAYDQVTKEQRTVAKPAVLGCGYGLGPGVIKNKDGSYTIQWKCSECRQTFLDQTHTCTDEKGNKKGDLQKKGLMGYAERMGVILTPEQAYKAWETFRKYKEIPKLWDDLEKAAIAVIKKGGKVRVRFVEFSRVKKGNQYILRILLPSGRYLHYMNARLRTVSAQTKDGRDYEKYEILYDGIGHGVGATSKQTRWGEVKTYGGKLAENIVQAISRDLLAHAMTLSDEIGMNIVGHVHDEILCEEKEESGRFGISDLKWCMTQNPNWALDLPLGADGYEDYVYRKG